MTSRIRGSFWFRKPINLHVANRSFNRNRLLTTNSPEFNPSRVISDPQGYQFLVPCLCKYDPIGV